MRPRADTTFRYVRLLRVASLLFIGAISILALSGCAESRIDVRGRVVDSVTGLPVPGAQIEGAIGDKQVAVTTDPDGRFAIEEARPDTKITIAAAGYRAAEVVVGGSAEAETRVEPLALAGIVSDKVTGKPIAGARVNQGERTTTTDAGGNYRLLGLVLGREVRWQADGYEAKVEVARSAGELSAQLRPNTLSGRVLDGSSRKPVVGATVSVEAGTTTTDAEGKFYFANLPARVTATAEAPGYEPARAEVDGATAIDLTLQPFEVRAAYLTYYGVSDEGLRGNVIDLIESTELNAVVIDIKGDFGRLAYKSEVPLAETIGANVEPTIRDITALLADLQGRGIYSIARIVVFKDDVLGRNGGKAGLDVAVKNASSGGPWIDGENLVWVDPYRTEVWDYNTALAVEAANLGFDEIQFDYIRFPTDPSPGSSVNAALFAKPSTEALRVEAIEGFLARARTALKTTGAKLSVDVFGYTCWRDDDMGIGQKIETIAKYVDFLAPMVYPSTYSDGLPMTPNYMDAPAYPYEIVFYSVERAVDRLKGTATKVRPWLQYFDDYPWESGREYNAAEIAAQKRAGAEAGGVGFMLWDPTNRFSRGGLEPD